MEPIELNTPEYIVELWDINNVFVADITALISGNLRVTMPLNDVEEVAFSLDLVQFELLAASIGARPINLIEPYRTDVKIKRNGVYLVGAHVVQTNVDFTDSGTNKLDVQCTGYLNYFKDRFLSAHYANMSYAQIARQTITDTQSAYNLITNGDFYEGIDGWQYWESGYIIWDSTTGYTYPGSLYVSVSTGPNTFGAARFNLALQAGLTYTLTYRIKPTGATGSTYIKAGTGGSAMNTTAVTDIVNWTSISHTWTQATNESSINIYMNTSQNFWIDDVKLSDNVDNATNRSFGVTLGSDTVTASSQTDRVRNYDLQNVKDAIINLSKLEEDKFDFEFTPTKVFNIYARKGTDKAQIELVYPQNIKSIKVTRSAAKLANKIYGLGSGIGNERIETSVLDYPSAVTYRIRERTEMFNSVELIGTLTENSIGALETYMNLDDNIDITIAGVGVDLNDIQTGDAIYVRVDGSSYIDYVNGLYRIKKIGLTVNQEFDEDITLELERWD